MDQNQINARTSFWFAWTGKPQGESNPEFQFSFPKNQVADVSAEISAHVSPPFPRQYHSPHELSQVRNPRESVNDG